VDRNPAGCDSPKSKYDSDSIWDAPPKYEAGFQKDAKFYFTYPYLLVQHLPQNNATISQITALLSQFESGETVRKLKASEFLKNVRIGQPVADSIRKIVLLNLENDAGESLLLICFFGHL
jgi:hypothetical protein